MGKIENFLIVMDHFTRHAHAFLLTAMATAKFYGAISFYCMVFQLNFFPDQGCNFESQLMTNLYQLAEVQKIRTNPYYPMTNGKCEHLLAPF